MTTRTLTVSVLAILLAVSANASDLGNPATPYSGTRVMTSDFGNFTSRVHHVEGKDRVEMDAGGQKMTTIIRHDKGVAWQIIEQANMYMEVPIEQAQRQDFSSKALLEKTEVGKETINGHAATKFKVSFQDEDGSEGQGFIWATEDDIMVKMEAKMLVEGQAVNVEVELLDLVVGPQDDALFEIPEGMQTMSMPGRNFDMSKMPRNRN